MQPPSRANSRPDPMRQAGTSGAALLQVGGGVRTGYGVKRLVCASDWEGKAEETRRDQTGALRGGGI